MKHESFRELLALSLYGELDATQSRELARHLEECADCTRFARELDSGLGALVRTQRPASEPALPHDWRARLDAACSSESRRRIAPWWTAAAGFAAGVALALALSSRMESGEAPRLPTELATDTAESAYLRFKQSSAPPLATTGGQLARLSRYLKR